MNGRVRAAASIIGMQDAVIKSLGEAPQTACFRPLAPVFVQGVSRIAVALSKRLASIGVSVSETSPETRIATVMVIATRETAGPEFPPMNSTGIIPPPSETVIGNYREPDFRASISAVLHYVFAQLNPAVRIFSSITTASSDDKPHGQGQSIANKVVETNSQIQSAGRRAENRRHAKREKKSWRVHCAKEETSPPEQSPATKKTARR